MSWGRISGRAGMEVVSQASASHRLADVERGAAAGHGVDDQGAGGGVVVECMRHQRRRDGTGVGDAEGAVVPERPDVVRRRAEIGAEAVAAAQVLVRGMDGLGPGVELGDAALRPGVARAGQPPDGAGLAIEILAAHPEVPGDRRIGPAPVTVRRDVLARHDRFARSNPRRRPDRRNSDIRHRQTDPSIRLGLSAGWPVVGRSPPIPRAPRVHRLRASVD